MLLNDYIARLEANVIDGQELRVIRDEAQADPGLTDYERDLILSRASQYISDTMRVAESRALAEARGELS